MAYFDNAATTFPKPICVYESMDQYYRECGGSAGRGIHEYAKSTGKLAADTRNIIKELLHCPSKQVVFEPTATISLNIIIGGLIESGAKTVYISPFEHNAVTRTLHHYEKTFGVKVLELAVSRKLSYDLDRIEQQFNAVRPDVVIVSHASNVIGLIAPVEKLFTLAKRFGAVTVADMAQTAGIVESNIGLECFDFAVFAGHKTLYGPTGISGFVMKPDIHLPPILFGGTGYDSSNQDMPDSLPERFEMGTLNSVGIAGLYASISWIQDIGIRNLYEEECRKRDQLIEVLGRHNYISIIGNEPDNKYVGIVSCLIDSISSDSAGEVFNRLNIAVRTGLHCAPRAHKFLSTFPAGTIRFSVGHFTTDEDFAELETALDYIEENL